MKPPVTEPRLQTVETYRRMLAMRWRYLDTNSRVLDFGCGAGALVYAFRDSGFDAYGFDIHDCLELRAPEDRRFFRIMDKGGDTSDFALVDWSTFRLPYPDQTFDLVISSQVMEHVQNHDAALKELARVMKPHSIAIHTLPSRYRPIEPHTLVPFGGMFKAPWYYRLWATLGIRSPHQKGRSAQRVAKDNARYVRTGTNYVPRAQLCSIGGRYFGNSWLSPLLWQSAHYAPGWRLTKPALRAYTLFDSLVWVLENPHATSLPKNAVYEPLASPITSTTLVPLRTSTTTEAVSAASISASTDTTAV